MAMDATFLQGRIDRTKELIVAYEDAICALAGGALASYTLDTGQSRQTVTKMDIASLRNLLNGFYNNLATMEARLNGSGTVTGRPGF